MAKKRRKNVKSEAQPRSEALDEAEPVTGAEPAMAPAQDGEPGALAAADPAATQAADPVATQAADPAATQAADPVATQAADPVATQAADPVATQAADPVAPPEAARQAHEPATPAAMQPWFGHDRGGLGIAGTARRPGPPGMAQPAPRPQTPNRISGPRAVVPPAEAGPPVQRTVRHVGSATRAGLVSHPPAPVAPTRGFATPAAPATPQPAKAKAQAGGAIRSEPRATGTFAAQARPYPGASHARPPAPSQDAAAGARPVVRVSLSQAAAAGNQTIRPLSPTMRTTVPTLARPTATASVAKEKPRREVAPAEPLAIPTDDALYFAVSGLGTPTCAARVERALRALPGVVEVDANLATGLVAVVPASIDRGAAEAALAAAGHPARAGTPGAAAARQESKRLAIAAAATLAVGIASHFAARGTGSALVGSLIAAVGLATAWPVVGQALRHLLRLRPSVELLPVTATVAILVAAWMAGAGSSALATLPLAAHLTIAALARLAAARALRVIEGLRAALPGGDGPRIGSRFEVAAGDQLPADGRLVRTTTLDESAIGGEDDVERLAGESVCAGAIATSGAVIDVLSAPGKSRVDRCLRIAERALATRPRGTPAQLASLLLVPVALALAVAAAILEGPWAAAAVLAGAAPLSFGLAAALASAAGITRAASRGVAVRSSAALDRAARSEIVLFDKTSTLTRGDAAVLELQVKAGRDPREVLAAAAAVEDGIDHGIARALRLHAFDLRVDVPQATERRLEPGLGVRARVGGRMVTVGSAQFAVQSGIDLGLLMQPVAELANRGRTPLVVAFDDEAVAVLGIAETPRESARQAMGSLELLDVELRVASGDAHAAVQWLTEAIGLDKRLGRGDLSSAAKKALVEELRGIGPCLVAGASTQDVDAMAAADLGVAAGTDPAVEKAAGALLVRHDPQGVVEIIRAGRAVRRGRNLATLAGLAGNAAAMGLAATGAIGVAGAATLSFCASLLALGAAASPWVRMR